MAIGKNHPDPPSRHHPCFCRGRFCGVAFQPEAGKRSLLSFDLEALDRLAA